jgi:hypothetical protein
MNGHDLSSRFLLLFWAIGFALIVKFFFVRRLTTLSLGKLTEKYFGGYASPILL